MWCLWLLQNKKKKTLKPSKINHFILFFFKISRNFVTVVIIYGTYMALYPLFPSAISFFYCFFMLLSLFLHNLF